MSYYAAGGYYSAGGFSWSKLKRAVHKATNFVASSPILSSVVGLVPGASTVLSGLQVADSMSHHSSIPAALNQSNHGTPGHQAWYGGKGQGRGMRRRVRRVRRRRAYA
jgi:hypothetical protein